MSFIQRFHCNYKWLCVPLPPSLREESTEEARRTKELVLGLGVKDHHTLTINWEGNPPPTPGKVQMRARERRYPMMLELCARKKIPVLLVSHHRDDQIGG